MTQPTEVAQVAIGACLSCHQLFLVTPESAVCILCGRPPAYTLPFSAMEQVGPTPESTPTASPSPVQPPTLIGVTCPHCHGNVQLSITDTEITVIPPPPPEPAEEVPGPLGRAVPSWPPQPSPSANEELPQAQETGPSPGPE